MRRNLYYSKTGERFEKPAHIEAEKRKSAYAYVTHNDLLLLVKAPWDLDRYCLPGGGLDENESMGQAAIRECYEETGYRIEVQETPVFQGSSLFFDNDTFYNCIYNIYKGSLITPAPEKEIPKNEIACVSWFRPELLNKKIIHPMFRAYMLQARIR